jgi:hypothetical protein
MSKPTKILMQTTIPTVEDEAKSAAASQTSTPADAKT